MASFPKDSAAESVPAPQQRVLSTPFSESPLPLGNRSKISPAVAGGVFVAIVAAAVVVAVQRTDLLADVPQLAWLKPAATAPVSTEEVPEQLAEASGEPEKTDSIKSMAQSSMLLPPQSAICRNTWIRL